MKINRIQLKNYRNHREKIVEFREGINLLLGKNGTGKSSIFEALGIAMFDIEPRDKSLKNAVNKGAKTATITVEFIGNDDNEYIVERKIGGQSKVILKEKNGTVLSERKDDVIRKIGVLAGIKGKNIKEIFRNVISANQNDIIGVFNETPSSRKELFNKIFDTEVYEQLYSILQLSEKKYNEQILSFESKVEILEKQIEEYAGKDLELEKVKKEIENLENELSKLKEKAARYDEKKKSLEEKINRLKEYEHKLDSLKLKEEVLQEKILKLEKDIDQSLKAKEIVMKSEEGYRKYKELEYEIENNSQKEKELILREKKKREIQEKIKRLESSEELLSEKLKTAEKRVGEEKEIINNKKDELEKLNEIYQKINVELVETEKQLKEQMNIKEKIDNEYDSYNILLEKRKNNLEIITEKEKKLQKLEELKVKLLEYEKNKEYLSNKLKEKEELKNKIREIQIKIENLKNSKEELKDGICPILNEKCLNLEQKKEGNNYFDVEIERLNKTVNEYVKQLELHKNIENEIAENDGNVIEIKSNISAIKKEIENIENIELENKTIENQINEIKEKYGDIREKRGKITAEINEISAKNAELKNELNNIFKNIKKYRNEINEKQNFILEITRKTEEYKSKILNIKSKRISLIDELKAYGDIEIEIEEIREIIERLKTERKRYKIDYDNYLKNKELSNKIEELKVAKQIEEENLENLKNTIQEVKEKILSFEKDEKLEAELKELNQKIKILYTDISEMNKILGGKRNERENLINILNELNKKEKERKEYIDKVQYFKKKLKLTKEFRENIKAMGKYVSERVTNIISTYATNNYREITGKNEVIIWDSSRDYLVILRDEIKGDRDFSILSGGEQVSVAISIRIALATFLSNANFYILDEPTSNLDEERKNLLAENLKKMLKNIEQAFIVTHDGTFSEMAENIINL
ncbi:ATPase involved in DNA repair [Marinitoga piezophila KA3]|uniref:ATPase involved in DNA repair n=1 Tax=Marinitoga piezophila (strain DSM 14283 / JCM 11233 / KA3) TaxID=443254 RepID=H2J2R9_MARPK|nr:MULTISPECIES: SMC family ATPase [Marinitoga]AEX84513.1 ATPase involved in DNA repair [Marinitoga piezophila KA3]APT75006.1 hypothetical protein LN42_00270 [Marinitoga sp. 1137]